jgi:hypothetical protein
LRIASAAPPRDRFGQLLNEWDNLVVTISTTALVSGSLRTFYTQGSAVFASLLLKGNESASYELVFTLSGPNLFGNNVEERSVRKIVTVQPCDDGETFDDFTMDCACAVGYGLIVTDHTCRACTADGTSHRTCMHWRTQTRMHVQCVHTSARTHTHLTHVTAIAALPVAQRLCHRAGCRAARAPR